MNKCAYKPDCPWYDGRKCNSPNDHTYNECDYDRGIFPEREKEQREQDAPDTNSGDTISRQAAIDVFKDTTYTKNEICRRITELPSAQPEQRWIPVAERLPEKGQKCLVSDKGHIAIDVFLGRGGAYNWQFYVRDYEAWMPLVQPYKEEEE